MVSRGVENIWTGDLVYFSITFSITFHNVLCYSESHEAYEHPPQPPHPTLPWISHWGNRHMLPQATELGLCPANLPPVDCQFSRRGWVLGGEFMACQGGRHATHPPPPTPNTPSPTEQAINSSTTVKSLHARLLHWVGAGAMSHSFVIPSVARAGVASRSGE